MTSIPATLGEAMEEVLWQSSYTSCSTTRGSNARKRFHFATDCLMWIWSYFSGVCCPGRFHVDMVIHVVYLKGKCLGNLDYMHFVCFSLDFIHAMNRSGGGRTKKTCLYIF
jgi:hypothetical protein